MLKQLVHSAAERARNQAALMAFIKPARADGWLLNRGWKFCKRGPKARRQAAHACRFQCRTHDVEGTFAGSRERFNHGWFARGWLGACGESSRPLFKLTANFGFPRGPCSQEQAFTRHHQLSGNAVRALV